MKKENKRGISLIVLVITIIVMIILATAIILSLSSSGIIGKANQAVTDTNTANLKEAANIALAEYELEVSIGGIDEDVTTAEIYVKEKLGSQGFSEKELGLLDISEDGKIIVYKYPVIPNGYVVSSVDTEDDITEGLVIYEGTEAVTSSNHETAMTSRNQYVWVPVPNISEFKRINWQNEEGFDRYTEPSSFTNTGSTTLYQYATEVAEYNKMKSSVETNGGFYIARYEAGTTTARTATTTGTSFKTGTTTPDILSQKNKPVYNYVMWAPGMTEVTGDTTDWGSINRGKGAVELAKGIYPENANNDVVSTLVYGVQWDAVMNFMKDVDNPNVPGKKYIEDSTGMGYYETDEYAILGRLATATGSSNNYKVKNIYDMAGNVSELTMEAYGIDMRVVRDQLGNGNILASSRSSIVIPDDATCGKGLRVALYIK